MAWTMKGISLGFLRVWLCTALACITMPVTNAMEASDLPRPGDIVFRTDFDTPESRAAWSQAPFATWARRLPGNDRPENHGAG